MKLKIANAHGEMHAMDCPTCFARLHVRNEITLDTEHPTTLKLTPVKDEKSQTIHWELSEA